ncbi:hypothetical protein Taro_012744, partial [Colocasia esculenta]|nr:hypothetical protein [Colocasia esculenta]
MGRAGPERGDPAGRRTSTGGGRRRRRPQKPQKAIPKSPKICINWPSLKTPKDGESLPSPGKGGGSIHHCLDFLGSSGLPWIIWTVQ